MKLYYSFLKNYSKHIIWWNCPQKNQPNHYYISSLNKKPIHALCARRSASVLARIVLLFSKGQVLCLINLLILFIVYDSLSIECLLHKLFWNFVLSMLWRIGSWLLWRYFSFLFERKIKHYLYVWLLIWYCNLFVNYWETFLCFSKLGKMKICARNALATVFSKIFQFEEFLNPKLT